MKTSLRLALAAFVLAAFNLSATTRYVWQDSPSPTPPYTTWATAATNIQDAVDAATTGDTVLVAAGVYAAGGRVTGTNQLVNRVAVDRAIRIESLMGPEATAIVSSHLSQVPVRCVYLADGEVLRGFTLTNRASVVGSVPPQDSSGGGVWCESSSVLVTNCSVE